VYQKYSIGNNEKFVDYLFNLEQPSTNFDNTLIQILNNSFQQDIKLCEFINNGYMFDQNYSEAYILKLYGQHQEAKKIHYYGFIPKETFRYEMKERKDEIKEKIAELYDLLYN